MNVWVAETWWYDSHSLLGVALSLKGAQSLCEADIRDSGYTGAIEWRDRKLLKPDCTTDEIRNCYGIELFEAKTEELL